MILSNEPGCYIPNRYGIRIENLQVVRHAADLLEGRRETLAFETLTLAPIDRVLVDLMLLTPSEVNWLNYYHRRVYETLGPLLDAEPAAWLEAATRSIDGP